MKCAYAPGSEPVIVVTRKVSKRVRLVKETYPTSGSGKKFEHFRSESRWYWKTPPCPGVGVDRQLRIRQSPSQVLRVLARDHRVVVAICDEGGVGDHRQVVRSRLSASYDRCDLCKPGLDGNRLVAAVGSLGQTCEVVVRCTFSFRGAGKEEEVPWVLARERCLQIRTGDDSSRLVDTTAGQRFQGTLGTYVSIGLVMVRGEGFVPGRSRAATYRRAHGGLSYAVFEQCGLSKMSVPLNVIQRCWIRASANCRTRYRADSAHRFGTSRPTIATTAWIASWSTRMFLLFVSRHKPRVRRAWLSPTLSGSSNYDPGSHSRGNAHAQLEDATEVLDGIEDEADDSGHGWHCPQPRFNEINALSRANRPLRSPKRIVDSSSVLEQYSDLETGSLTVVNRDLPIGAVMEDLP